MNIAQQIVNGLVLGSGYACIALGWTILLGVARLVNFAHGQLYMLGAFATWYAMTRLDLPYPLRLILMRRHADADQRADLQELEPDGAAGGVGEGGLGEADAAQRADQHIGHRGEPQPQLVGAHGGGRGAVGEQIELAFLDAVLHLAAGAVDVLVELARSPPRRA